MESRNAESVLNAVILSSYDARQGHLTDTTRTAFDNAWALQSTSGPTTGAWVWQNFHYTPWESPESEYHGAALMAVAVAKAPDHYRDDPKIAANLAALAGYLSSHYEAQPLLNKVVALWPQTGSPACLRPLNAHNCCIRFTLFSGQTAAGVSPTWAHGSAWTTHRLKRARTVTRPA